MTEANTFEGDPEAGGAARTRQMSSIKPDRREAERRWLPDDWRGDTALVVALMAGVVVLHVAVPGLVPSGGDGGNWLALAAERFGNGVMAADVSYPPLLPVLLGLVEGAVADKILAITMVAIAAKATLVVATYFATRTLTRWYALTAGIIVTTGGYLLEAYAWGGYTQLLAMGLGLLGSLLFIRYLVTEKKIHLWIGLVLCAMTLLTHTMVGGLLGVSLLLAVLHYMYLANPGPGQRKRLLRVGLLTAGSVLVLAVVGYLLAAAQGLEATVNPIGMSRVDAVVAAVREAPYPWLVIAILGIGVLVFRSWSDEVASTIALGSSWTLSSLTLFAAVGEPRALLVTQMGMVLLAMVGIFTVLAALRSVRGWKAVFHPLAVIAGVSLVAALAVGGVAVYTSATDWYRVVDHDEIASLNRLAADSEPGDLVLAANGHHGNPIGWWVQGYAERPTYTAMNPAFLAFPDEREQAEIANQFFSGELSEEESFQVLKEIGARYVVVDKRHSDAWWLGSDLAKSFVVIDGSSNVTILRVDTEVD